MAVLFGQLCNLRCVNCGQGVFIRVVVNADDRTDAEQGGRLFANPLAIFGQHGNVTVQPGEFAGTAQATGGARVQLAAVMFGDNQDSAHQGRSIRFSSATSSAASATIFPFCRTGGAAVCKTVTRVCGVIPNSSSSIVASGLRFAFMISGIFT